MENGIRRTQSAPALLHAPNAAGNDAARNDAARNDAARNGAARNDAAGNDGAVRANGAPPADQAQMQARRESARAQLRYMPDIVLNNIASHLRGQDVRELADFGGEAVSTMISLHLDRANATIEASQVSTRENFRTSLNNIRNLPSDHQAEPLFQLGLRARAVPTGRAGPEGLPTAVRAFLRQARALPENHRTPELTELMRVAGYTTPNEAVQEGENVGVVSRFWNPLGRDDVGIPDGRYLLEREAIRGAAGDAVRGGQNVLEVARRHGIEDRRSLARLDMISREVTGEAFLRV